MKRHFAVLTSAFAIVVGFPSHPWAQGSAPIATETARQIDAVFAAWATTSSPGCALGVSRNGNQVYSRGYGMANLEHDVPITPDSIFNIGSVSKQFTAFSIALLANDGKLSIDDDIRRYLPELPDYGQPIRIRHLLTHTSGLREGFNLMRLAGWPLVDGVHGTEGDLLRMVARQKSLNDAPGTVFRYNNSGYTLLAVIVKRVSGQSLREFAEARIFGPLGMGDSHFHDDRTMMIRRGASAYRPRPNGGWGIISSAVSQYQEVGQSAAIGSGGVYATVGDLLKWEQNFIDARIGGRAMLDEMQRFGRLNDGQTIPYGFGLWLEPQLGLRSVWHGGSADGFLSSVIQFPDQALAIAILCNVSTASTDELANRVTRILLGPGTAVPPAPLAPEVPVEETVLTALTGRYWNPITDSVLHFTVKEGKLVEQGSSLALTPLGGGRFRVGSGRPLHEVWFPSPKSDGPQEMHNPPPTFEAPFSCRSWSAACGGPFSAVTVAARVRVPTYSAAELKAYVGEYRSDELQATFAVVATPEGGLVVLRERVEPMPLTVVTVDMFSGTGTAMFTFRRAPSGGVTGLDVSYRGLRGVSFTKFTRSTDPKPR
jgi:CubicO group peptidase (beta-lactamase class C family)